jgi:polyisoprenoid-binding protein YceI
MQAPSGQMTAPALQALLKDGALAGEWVLDPRKSSIRLKSRSMWGLAPVNGVFREVRGHGTVSLDGEVSGTVTVAAASIDTKNTRRDTHLRSADFFDSGNHPDIIFTADGIRLSGQGVAVTGALTVRDRARPCPSMPRRPSRTTARSGSTRRSTSTGAT